jgi:hypothetical protein
MLLDAMKNGAVIATRSRRSIEAPGRVRGSLATRRWRNRRRAHEKIVRTFDFEKLDLRCATDEPFRNRKRFVKNVSGKSAEAGCERAEERSGGCDSPPDLMSIVPN